MGEPTNKIYTGPVELALDLLAGKWKPLIMQQLRGGVGCFGELKRSLPLVNQRTLQALLRELERDAMVERVFHTEVPLRVEYRLTSEGQHLVPILDALESFGRRYAGSHGIELLGEEDDLPVILAAG